MFNCKKFLIKLLLPLFVNSFVFYKNIYTNQVIRYSKKINFNDIIGHNLIKDEFKQIIDIIHNKNKYNNLDVSLPQSIIIEGPPGNGKTMFANAISNECNCSFLYLTGFDFIDGYDMDKKNNKIIKLHNLALKDSPSIIFIDDIDYILSKNDKDHFASEKYI